MVGMLQIITYLLCVYLIFKGIEIWQIANVKSNETDGSGLSLGAAMIVIAVIVAIVFIVWINDQAETVSNTVPRFP